MTPFAFYLSNISALVQLYLSSLFLSAQCLGKPQPLPVKHFKHQAAFISILLCFNLYLMAASSNAAGQPKYGPRNACDGLRVVLPVPAASGQPKYGPPNAFDSLRIVLPARAASGQQVYPIISAFDGLRITPPIPDSTYAAYSSATKNLAYDVFINHHGGDVKRTVANNIYNSLDATGLRVFLDKNKLELGDFFPTALEEAIRSASIHIAIFSEHYAQSPWCLAELALMVKTGTKIIPVFYHVEPSTLRWAIHGEGMYAEAFSEYERKNRYSSEQLRRWKWALHEVSFITGGIIKSPGDEKRVVKSVVDLVMKETKVPLVVAKHPVGLDEALQNFDMNSLQLENLFKNPERASL